MSERDRELASLKREFQELREQQKELRSTVKDLRSERETFIDTIAAKTPVSRRQVNILVSGLGITGAVSYLASKGVLAAGESWGSSTGTMGTDAEPLANSNVQDLDVQTLATEQAIINTVLRTPETTETISSGAIPYSGPYIEVSGESGANDNLDEMTGGTQGDICILESGSETITVRDGQGTPDSFLLDGNTNKSLSSTHDKLMVIYQGGRWNQLAFSNNA